MWIDARFNRDEKPSKDHEEVKKKALSTAAEWMDIKPVFLDTETTGLGRKAEVIEIGIVDHQGTELINTLVRPVSKISSEAQAVHGISEEDVANAPTWPEIHDEVYEILNEQPVVIYNYSFDTRIIDQTIHYHWFTNNSIDWPKSRCAMKLYARYQGSWNDYYHDYSWHKLSQAAKHLGIENKDSHRAINDAETTRKIIKRLAKIHKNPEAQPEPKEGPKKDGWLP